MAKISLKAYLGDIEAKIEEGQIDEALGHCRRILKNYPKHVDSYRLMGKAYLEQKRHSSAGDIFQRVLSSAPDDFISHVGMSIIREEQKDQDASIWHMERAFESQPSNRAVQDELRRLYKAREGFAPPKIRLTRGALARMYAHGDLYSQAIGELRAALNEDPNRPDLEVLLAEMYFKTEQKNEALKIGMRLLKRLPFCLFANLLVAEILTGKGREAEAKTYLEIARELDPYSTLGSDKENPDEDVTLSHLVLDDSQTEDTQEAVPEPIRSEHEEPEEEVSSFEKEELPDWLSGPLAEAEEQSETRPANDAGDSLSDDLLGLVPDSEEPSQGSPTETMGDSPSDDLLGLVPEEDVDKEKPGLEVDLLGPVSEEEPELEDDVLGLVPEEEPGQENDALGLVPEEEPSLETTASSQGEGFAKAEEESPSSGQDIPDWLQDLLPSQETREAISQEDTAPAETSPEETNTAAEQTAPTEEPDNNTDDLTWLQELTPQQDIEGEGELAETQEGEPHIPELVSNEEEEEAQDGSPAWLDEIPAEEESLAAENSLTEEVDVPGSVDEADNITAPVEETFNALEENETPDWLKDLAAEAERTSQPSRSLQSEALANAPDWLASLQKEGEEEETEFTPSRDADTRALQEHLENVLAEDTDDPGKTERVASTEESAWVPETSIESQTDSLENEDPAFTSREHQPPSPAARSHTTTELRLEKATQNLELARQAMNSDKLDDALEHYQSVLGSRAAMDEVIADLQAALNKHPNHVGLWQTLGDAYMRSDSLREALDCYTKAEDLL